MGTNSVLLSKWFYCNTLCYNPILGLIKASMVLLYLRLGGTKEGVRTVCYILLVINFAHAFGSLIADMLQCLPIRYNWDRESMDIAAQVTQNAIEPGTHKGSHLPTGFKNGTYVTGGRCFNLEMFLLSSAGIALFTDLLIMSIPIYMVYDLPMKLSRKAMVAIILCMGVL